MSVLRQSVADGSTFFFFFSFFFDTRLVDVVLLMQIRTLHRCNLNNSSGVALGIEHSRLFFFFKF